MPRYKLVLPSIFLMATAAVVPAFCQVAFGAASTAARAPEGETHAPIPDSAKSLKRELKNILKAARNGKSERLRAMIKDLEIPDARAWYLTNFGTSGAELADEYKKNLAKSEDRLENQMIAFAREDGYISVKKQNPKKAYPSSITSPEVYLATWKRNSFYPEDSSEMPFGYFLFIDGKFRWDSTTMWVTVD